MFPYITVHDHVYTYYLFIIAIFFIILCSAHAHY